MTGQAYNLGRALTIAFLCGAVLIGCAKKERILQGERLDIRAPLLKDGEKAEAESVEEVRIDKLALAKPSTNAEWTHKNGTAQHLIRHPALGRSLTKVWSVNIGTGNSKKHAITTSPIVGGGRVFSMDANANVRAFTTAGAPVWAQDLTPPNEKSGEASGGGLAFEKGLLAATTGHGEVVLMEAATGAIRWRHQMTGAISADPVIVNNTVIAVSRNNVALGLDIKNGRILWQQLSPGNVAGVAGSGAPAALGKLAVVPYASGEIVGAVTSNGLRAWSASVTGGNKGLARNLVSDVSSDPVWFAT